MAEEYQLMFRGRDLIQALELMAMTYSQEEMESVIAELPRSHLYAALLALGAEEHGHDSDWWDTV